MTKNRVNIGLLILMLLVAAAPIIPAQVDSHNSPTVTVKLFYELLRTKRYAEGLGLSVYKIALEGLTADDLRELEPEFERLATSLPDQVEIRGEQISGNEAIVFLKLPNVEQAQQVSLMKMDNRWVIGDRETQSYLKKQGRNYFFHERIRVHESEVNEWMLEILGAQLIYFKAKQKYAPLDELIKLGGVSAQLADGTASGYRFELTVGDGGRSFIVTAYPLQYGRTGTLGFYADQTNVVRAEDRAGKPAFVTSSPYLQDGK